MTTADWVRVIDQAAALRVPLVQFIGGEPTLHPDLGALVRHALSAGVGVEVYSNLVHVPDPLWAVFSQPGVRLATSYYSTDPGEHRRITGRPSLGRTRANIVEAVRRGIRIRAGIIGILAGQRAAQAEADLRALGVAVIGIDRLRGVGRGVAATSVEALCGRCGRGRAAISPDGEVWPCVLSRWMSAGSVTDKPLAEILTGPAMQELVATIPMPSAVCVPDCNPGKGDGSDCAPAETEACDPAYDDE